MKTVVYQAFTGEKPAWIDRCMASVQKWAAGNNYDYRFIGDRMLDYVPRWYRDKVGNEIALMADLARLKIAREFLSHGYERTIWVDADIIIFDTGKFMVENNTYAFGREIWSERLPDGRLACKENVNNGVLVFTRRHRLLLHCFILAFMLNIRRSRQRIPFNVHIRFLTNLYRYLRIPLLTNVGQFSPAVMDSIINNNVGNLSDYMLRMGSPIYASNLCFSQRNKCRDGITLCDDMYERVIDLLLESQGAFLNAVTAARPMP